MTVNLTWEVEPGVPVALEVAARYASSPGNRRGHPDSWAPAWRELEILDIKNARGCPLPAAVVGKLAADDGFLRAVERGIKEG